MSKDVTALKIIAKLKYGNKVDFGTPEQAKELVKKYPILYPYLPESLRLDKQIALAFCESEGKLLDEYDARADAPVYNRRPASEYDNVAHLHGKIDFSFLLKDKDVLAAIGKNGLCRFIDFSDESYDEKALGCVLKEYPRFVINAYTFWLSRIGRDAKQTEHLRTKYELYNMPDAIELTFYKCKELIEKHCPKANELAYFYLLSCCTHFSTHFGSDYLDVMRTTFRSLGIDLQKTLVARYYFFARFIRPDDLDEGVVKTIAEFCPIGAEILPDEMLLRYRLTPQGMSGDDMRQACRDCEKCNLMKYFYEEDYLDDDEEN